MQPYSGANEEIHIIKPKGVKMYFANMTQEAIILAPSPPIRVGGKGDQPRGWLCVPWRNGAYRRWTFVCRCMSSDTSGSECTEEGTGSSDRQNDGQIVEREISEYVTLTCMVLTWWH